ncbi:MAG TPA: TylF/MycF/NovP-related O-methyltransferase [Actinomycetota bacterium]|nr:TylF/MycF/NovP-related O-methyltransferase [Actinomycetota bacterium]
MAAGKPSRPTPGKKAGNLRTKAEQEVGPAIERIFERSSDSVEQRLEAFPKYVRRQHLTRFIALYELFKQVVDVKGSVVECGVWRGFGLMTWAKLSAILEPNNLTRRVYGFDSFSGFPAVHDKDANAINPAVPGDLASDSYDELQALIEQFDQDRFLGHIPKVELIDGDATETIPKFVAENPHLVISLLFLDFDLYEPTRAAIEHLVPRMPRGAILAFDELDNPIWPGETLALVETLGVGSLRIRRLPFDPYIGYAVIE